MSRLASTGLTPRSSECSPGGRARKHRRVVINVELRRLVQERLDKRWSPEQISNSLQLERPDRPDLHLAPESIYQALYAVSSVLTTGPRVVLRTGTLHRHRRSNGERSSRFIVPMTPIKERPPAVNDSVEAGHWEGDLITGTLNKSAIGTLVERSTRFTILVHFVGTHAAEQLRDSMTAIFNRLPGGLRRSLTWDQGIEMDRHHEFTTATAMPVYFCEAHSPWQRGTNENTNGLLRQYSRRTQTYRSTPPTTSSEPPMSSTDDHGNRSCRWTSTMIWS